MGNIQYPITVQKIEFEKALPFENGYAKTGTLVRVRPCAEKYEDKTFLGIFLGEFPTSTMAFYNAKEQVLTVEKGMYNATIFIPDENAIVFGYESWWSIISDKDQLKDITDEDIQNQWYVKALKQIEEIEKEENEED